MPRVRGLAYDGAVVARVPTVMTDAGGTAGGGGTDSILDAVAQLNRVLSPEVCGISFHDQSAETLWMSEDYLLPEDHRLVEDSLADREAIQGMSYG